MRLMTALISVSFSWNLPPNLLAISPLSTSNPVSLLSLVKYRPFPKKNCRVAFQSSPNSSRTDGSTNTRRPRSSWAISFSSAVSGLSSKTFALS